MSSEPSKVKSTFGSEYDVIIVGGRPAGASLAIRLGREGVRVLLLERDTMPSVHPASSPAIYASAMALLDEIGVPESEYAANTPPVRRWIFEARDHFTAEIPIPDVHGRDYAYAPDRARFDGAIWKTAANTPNVTVQMGFSVSDLLWDALHSRVIGVIGRDDSGATRRYTADLVVGADGRFGIVARKADARAYHAHNAHPTSILYAYWRGVDPYDDRGTAAHLHNGGRGCGFLVVESADDTTLIAIEGRADRLEAPPGEAAVFYESLIRQQAPIVRRLHHAERVTNVRGMRRIANLYRTAGGAGWLLTGDAVHQKDPYDGQGIYDALLTAKLAAQCIVRWQHGEAWSEALRGYEHALHEATYAMYKSTLSRVFRELFVPYPSVAYATVIGMLFNSPEYGQRFGSMTTRTGDPSTWFSVQKAVLPVLRTPIRALFGR
jgi:flavin-dependent dehydrogenase